MFDFQKHLQLQTTTSDVISLEEKNNSSWQRKQLTISYRLTAPMCDFINQCLLYDERIIPHDAKNSTNMEKPDYIICNQFSTTTLTNIISKPYIDKYGVEEIFILAPSEIRKNTHP